LAGCCYSCSAARSRRRRSRLLDDQQNRARGTITHGCHRNSSASNSVQLCRHSGVTHWLTSQDFTAMRIGSGRKSSDSRHSSRCGTRSDGNFTANVVNGEEPLRTTNDRKFPGARSGRSGRRVLYTSFLAVLIARVLGQSVVPLANRAPNHSLVPNPFNGMSFYGLGPGIRPRSTTPSH